MQGFIDTVGVPKSTLVLSKGRFQKIKNTRIWNIFNWKSCKYIFQNPKTSKRCLDLLILFPLRVRRWSARFQKLEHVQYRKDYNDEVSKAGEARIVKDDKI